MVGLPREARRTRIHHVLPPDRRWLVLIADGWWLTAVTFMSTTQCDVRYSTFDSASPRICEATRKREYRNVRRMPSRPLMVVTGRNKALE